MNHTPGPWKYGPDAEGTDAILAGSIGQATVGFPVCDMDPTVGMTDEIMRANARLMAAAPEMHAALVRAAQGLEHDQSVEDLGECDKCHVLAALKKSRGET